MSAGIEPLLESGSVIAVEPSASNSGPPAGSETPLDDSKRSDCTPVLFDGSEDGRLLPQLLDRLNDRSLDRIDMAVSFVMKSGLACIIRPLEDALDRGAHVRILTTDYLAITDPDALTQLADLAGGGGRRLEVRLFSGGSVAFHPKAYIFWSSAGETAAGYVGSSNLSASGIDGGVEWNLGVDRVEQLVEGFETLWADESFEALLASIEQASGHQVDIATACGLGRRTPETADEPIRRCEHLAVTRPQRRPSAA